MPTHHLRMFEPEPHGDECETVLREIRQFRERVVTAWQERAVLLTAGEQERLHAEIKRTCQLLSDLTEPPRS